MTQWIVIDDSDSAITYNTADLFTPWIAVNKSIPGTVDLDNAIFQTGHVLSSNGSLSISFTGTDIEVFGVYSKLVSPLADIFDFTWTCSIDDIAIPTNRSALDGFPWTSYCSQAGMTNESHVLHVNVSTQENSQFWLDYIRYIPLPGPLPENQTILVESTDPAIQYGTDWKPLGTAKFTKNDTGSMSFTFKGAGITWYSLALPAIIQTDSTLSGAFPDEAGSALITMDGVPRNITIPNNGQLDDPSYDMPLFEYDGLDPATEHILTATYQVDASFLSTPPLTLDFLLVQTGPGLGTSINSSGTSTSALPTQSISSTPPVAQTVGKESHRMRTGTIIGAVLGPLLLFFAILVGVRSWHRRQRTLRARALSALTDGSAGNEYRVWPQGAWREDGREGGR